MDSSCILYPQFQMCPGHYPCFRLEVHRIIGEYLLLIMLAWSDNCPCMRKRGQGKKDWGLGPDLRITILQELTPQVCHGSRLFAVYIKCRRAAIYRRNRGGGNGVMVKSLKAVDALFRPFLCRQHSNRFRRHHPQNTLANVRLIFLYLPIPLLLLLLLLFLFLFYAFSHILTSSYHRYDIHKTPELTPRTLAT